MLDLFKHSRRRRILKRRSIPYALWHETLADIPSLAALDAETRKRLHDFALIFMNEKSIEAAGGLELTDPMRVRIAALACRPILELGLDAYAGFHSVIVYPGEFLVRDREYEDEDGVVHVGDDVLSGEAWEQGPVILGWDDVLASGRGDAYDVVAHEFAHKLDLLDGAINGMPDLPSEMSPAAWIAAFEPAYEELCARVERDEDTWLDPYAAEDPGEFFAVCTEMFFDVPAELRAEYPAIYAQLAAYFKQHPQARTD